MFFNIKSIIKNYNRYLIDPKINNDFLIINDKYFAICDYSDKSDIDKIL